MSEAKDNKRSIILMLLATAVIAVSDTLVRLTTETMPVGQFMVMRGVLASTLFLIIVATTTATGTLRMGLNRLVILRAILEAGSVLLYIAALQVLMIAEVTAIYLASPLVASAFVAMLGLERVDLQRWAALIIGFIGVIIVMSPDYTTLNTASLLAFGSAVLVALRDIITRRTPLTVPSSLVTLCTTIAVSIIGLAMMPFEGGWVQPDQHQFILVVSAGFVVALGNLLAVASFRVGEVGVVSLFRYASLPCALLVGVLIWHEIPQTSQLIGAVIVCFSGMIMISRVKIPRKRKINIEKS